jgi:hypothetical protein
MRNYIPDHKINLCYQYINGLTKETWPDNELLRIDLVYLLQVWKDGDKYYSAIYSTLTRDWIFLGTPKH